MAGRRLPISIQLPDSVIGSASKVPTVAELDAPERIALFCIASGTSLGKAAATGTWGAHLPLAIAQAGRKKPAGMRAGGLHASKHRRRIWRISDSASQHTKKSPATA